MGNSNDLLYGIKPSKLQRRKRRDKRLFEELIECGRYNGGDRNRKTRVKSSRKMEQKAKWRDSVPYRECIRQQAKEGPCTYPSDNLEPLLRWLESQVGRPWSQVFAELGSIANPNSMHGTHIRQHLWDFVQPACRLDEQGQVIIPGRCGDVAKRVYGQSRYYVHPKTGLFLKHPDRMIANPGPFPKKARWKKEKEKRRSKIRQGIPHRPPAPEMGIDATGWACFRTRSKRIREGDCLDVREGESVFRAQVESLRLYQAYRYKTAGKYNFRTADGVRPELSVRVRVVQVLAGAHLVGDPVHLLANADAPAGWTAYDAGRLFR